LLGRLCRGFVTLFCNLEDFRQRLFDVVDTAVQHVLVVFASCHHPQRDRTTGVDPVALTGIAARIVIAEPELALGHYLLGRIMSGRGVPARAAQSLATALDKKLPHPLLEREAARRLAVSAYRAGRYDLVRRAAGILTRADQPEVARLFGLDWLDRVHWKETGKLPER